MPWARLQGGAKQGLGLGINVGRIFELVCSGIQVWGFQVWERMSSLRLRSSVIGIQGLRLDGLVLEGPRLFACGPVDVGWSFSKLSQANVF